MPNLHQILPLIPGFILGLTFHEFSHAFVADRLGDSTARQMGRLTLNPMAHLDLWGSLMLIFAGIGWAKPVPINYHNLHSPRRDMLLVSLAGPASNLLLAAVLALIIRALLPDGPHTSSALPAAVVLIFVQGVWINVILAVFNVIPVPPLDGSQLLAAMLPDRWQRGYAQIARLSPLVLLGVVLLASFMGISILGRIIMPVAYPVFKLVMGNWLAL